MGTWVCWIALLLCLRFFRRWQGIVFGELTAATTVFLLHFRWEEQAMLAMPMQLSHPFDQNFYAGALLHAGVVCILLFPVGLCGGLIGMALRRGKPPGLPTG